MDQIGYIDGMGYRRPYPNVAGEIKHIQHAQTMYRWNIVHRRYNIRESIDLHISDGELAR